MRPLWIALLCWCVPNPAWAGAVAVLYFDNQGNPDLEPLRVGLTQMIVTDLASDPKIEVVERTRIQDLLDELKLGHSGRVDPATSARIGQLVGAEYLVLGTYFELAGTLRIDARLVRVQTGEIVAAAGRSGATTDLLGMEKSIAASIAAALEEHAPNPAAATPHEAPAERAAHAKPPNPGDDRTAHAEPPATRTDHADPAPAPTIARKADPLRATLELSRGLVALDAKDEDGARSAFESALDADPTLDAATVELHKLAH